MAVLALAVAAGCDSKKEAVMTSGIDLTNLDTTAVQGADFYQYACGGWMKKHPLTNEYSRFGSFDMLAENNREQLKGLIVEIAAGQNAQGTIGQKIGDIYNLAMDSVKLNADGVTPIQADLEKIASVKDKSEIVPLMAELAHSGVFPYFSFYVGADIMDSKSNLFQLYQGGISMGEKEYYLDNDDVTVNIRNKYKEHIVKMFQLAGFDEAAAKKKMEAVMDIETRIAKASFSAFCDEFQVGGILPVLSIIVYAAFFMMSWGPICWVLIAEIFPNTIRGKAVAIAVAFQWIFNYLVSSTFPAMYEFSPVFAYGLYGVICVLAALFVWKMVSETKGKTLEDMTRLWKERAR